jgi:hypothetical protein
LPLKPVSANRLSVADIKSAFRHIDFHADDILCPGFWGLSGPHLFESTLPFGIRSSPGICDTLG